MLHTLHSNFSQYGCTEELHAKSLDESLSWQNKRHHLNARTVRECARRCVDVALRWSIIGPSHQARELTKHGPSEAADVQYITTLLHYCMYPLLVLPHTIG